MPGAVSWPSPTEVSVVGVVHALTLRAVHGLPPSRRTLSLRYSDETLLALVALQLA